MKDRSRNSRTGEKVVKREICNVFTKGTFIDTTDAKKGFSNKYCMAITQFSAKDLNRKNLMNDGNIYCETDKYYGFVIFDVGTLQFYLGEIKDDETYQEILTLLYSIRPEEIIILKKNLPTYIENFITTLSSKPKITRITKDFSNALSYSLADKYFGSKEKWNDLVRKYVVDENYLNISASFFLAASYLENILLADQVI